MARELRRLLIPPQRLAEAAEVCRAGDPGRGAGLRLVCREQERHYLQRVLRLRPGDQVAVVDGCGGLWTARLEAGGGLRLEQPLATPLQRQRQPQPPLQLALALPRRDVELVWRMATELGIERLQPLRAERCPPAGEAPLQRWRVVVAEACEQCERLWLPELAEPQEALAWLGAASASGAHRLLATTRHPDAPLLAEVLEGLPAGTDPVSLAVGPEGGWADGEIAGALAAGWRPVSLGPLILRSGTAAVAAAAQLCAWRHLRTGAGRGAGDEPQDLR